MPFASKAQQRFLYATKPKGVNLKEWSKDTNFKKLPEKVKHADITLNTIKIASALMDFGVPGILGGVLGGIGASATAPKDELFNRTALGVLIGSGAGLGQRALLGKLTAGRFGASNPEVEHALYDLTRRANIGEVSPLELFARKANIIPFSPIIGGILAGTVGTGNKRK